MKTTKLAIFLSLTLLVAFAWIRAQTMNTPLYAASETATPPPGMYTNPVLTRDFPDPDVLQVDDMFYAYATNSEGVNVQVAWSTDLIHWDVLPDALPQLPAWAAQDFGWIWAPEVTHIGEQYVMYHVARDNGIQCISVAVSASPEGPFTPVGSEPLICQTGEGGSIDPATFLDDDGTRYILWKNDGNAVGSKTWIYIQPLSEDGLALTGEATPILTRDQGWEGRLIEAPTLWKHNDRYVLFYSANDYASPQYAIGYATSAAILGPYEKPLKTPLLKSNIAGGVLGPGGQDIVQLADGSTWMLYHGWIPDGRALYLTELTWTEDKPAMSVQRAPQPVPIY